MNYKKSNTFFYGLILTMASSTAYAVTVSNPSNCPSGTVAELAGNDSEGKPIYECVTATSIPISTADPNVYPELDIAVNTQQITRNTSSAVNRHLMDNIFNAFSLPSIGASSDSKAYMPDVFWGETSISQITEESGNTNIADFDSDIYQFIGGVDKRSGNFFYGAALSYAYTENEVTGGADSTMHTIGMTPYVAYSMTDYLFASALASYYYSHVNNIAGIADIDTHDYEVEGNINAYKVIDRFILKARAGVRYKHSNNSGTIGGDSTFDELTWIGDAEVGYRFDNGLTLFTGTLYEHYDREASAVSARIRDNIFLMRYGVDYPVYDNLTIGAKIENDLNDEDRDYFTGTLHLRLEL